MGEAEAETEADAAAARAAGDHRPDLPVVVPVAASAELVRDGQLAPEDEEKLRAWQSAADAPRTIDAYEVDLRQFAAWCRAKGFVPLPASPKVVALWAVSLVEAGRKIATVERKLAAVSSLHTRRGLASPVSDAEVKRTLKGLRNTVGVAKKQARPLLPEHLVKIAGLAPKTARWRRDRAMLWMALACALRRSELVALRVEHVRFDAGGMAVLVAKSKTDQTGVGKWKYVPNDLRPWKAAVVLTQRWMKMAGVVDGYLFRDILSDGRAAPPEQKLSLRIVERIVRRAIALIGDEDPVLYGGHSMRSGFVTDRKAAGKDYATIMRQTGHSNTQTVDDYDRPQDPYGASNPLR